MVAKEGAAAALAASSSTVAAPAEGVQNPTHAQVPDLETKKLTAAVSVAATDDADEEEEEEGEGDAEDSDEDEWAFYKSFSPTTLRASAAHSGHLPLATKDKETVAIPHAGSCSVAVSSSTSSGCTSPVPTPIMSPHGGMDGGSGFTWPE